MSSVICYRWKLLVGPPGKQELSPVDRLMENPGSVKVPASVEYATSFRSVILIDVACCEKLPLPARAGVACLSALLSMPCWMEPKVAVDPDSWLASMMSELAVAGVPLLPPVIFSVMVPRPSGSVSTTLWHRLVICAELISDSTTG